MLFLSHRYWAPTVGAWLLLSVTARSEQVTLQNLTESEVTVSNGVQAPFVVQPGREASIVAEPGALAAWVSNTYSVGFTVVANRQYQLTVHGQGGVYGGQVWDDSPDNAYAAGLGLSLFGCAFVVGLMVRLISWVRKPASGDV